VPAEGILSGPGQVILRAGSAGPHHRVRIAAVGDLHPHHEPHPVQPFDGRRCGAGLGVRPEGLAVIDPVERVLDVAVR
jgi:hypothetical protein